MYFRTNAADEYCLPYYLWWWLGLAGDDDVSVVMEEKGKKFVMNRSLHHLRKGCGSGREDSWVVFLSSLISVLGRYLRHMKSQCSRLGEQGVREYASRRGHSQDGQ